MAECATVKHVIQEQQFPFLDLQAQFAGIKEETLRAVQTVLESQHFILGSEVERLETEVARFLEVRSAIGCASGSDALLLALLSLGVNAGDEVITSPFTFVATAGSIARLNALPVFVDIEPHTYNIDPERVRAAITSKTRAIVPVHLFGMPATMGPIMEIAAERNLPVVEDAAQAIGARYHGARAGSIGTIGCLSFFPSKNLGGAGDGGMLITNDTVLADRLRMLRVHGSRRKYHYETLGVNSRLDALQAAILRVKLRHLDEWTAARQRNAARYCDLLRESGLEGSLILPIEPDGCVSVYNQFVVRVERRDDLQQHLRLRGIPTEIYYPAPLHVQPAFAYLGHQYGDFPHAEKASRQVLALPIFPELTADQQQAVVEAIAGFYRA